ncbi:MAG: hypothetical protein ACFFCQ_12605 [Promethearchaeota archaeon]
MEIQNYYQEEIRTQLEEIEREQKLLNVLLVYYEKKNEIMQLLGQNISIRELKRYIQNNNYPEFLDSDIDVVKSKVEKRLANLTEMKTKTEKRQVEKVMVDEEVRSELGSLDQLLFFPSWRKLLETDFRGFYLNQPVLEIISDTVVLLPDLALTGLEDTIGEPYFFIVGPGIYYTTFRLSPGEIITDYREITGILLPLDVYEKAQDISGSMIQSTQNLRMTEYMTSIPFSLILARQTTQMFLRGVIARNVLHPHKEAYDLLLQVCKEKDSFIKEEGFKILSGGLSTKVPLYTNEILTEIPVNRNNYSNLTAGIKNIQPKVEKIITDLQIKDMKDQLFEKMRRIKEDFVKIGHPQLTDWII